MKPTGFATVLLLVIGTPAHAFMFCSKPDAPYCIDGFGTYDSEWSFQSCKREVEAYLSAVDAYVQCLRDEQGTAISEADAAVERFNCKARGSSFCP